MCCKTMCHKVLPTIFILIALALALLVTFFHQRPFAMTTLMNVGRFFEVMIPVLAVGSLIKYISGCPHCHRHDDTCCKMEEKK